MNTVNTSHSNKSFFERPSPTRLKPAQRGKCPWQVLGRARAGVPQLLGITAWANQAFFFSLALFMGFFCVSKPGKPMHKLVHPVAEPRIQSRTGPFNWWGGNVEPFRFPQLSHNVPENPPTKNPDGDQEDEEHRYNRAGDGPEHSHVRRRWVPRGQRPQFLSRIKSIPKIASH